MIAQSLGDVVSSSHKALHMLVLSRKRDQQIVIGDGIVLTVIEVRGDKVRLGIEAPPEVAVHRREIYEALQQQVQPAPTDSEGS